MEEQMIARIAQKLNIDAFQVKNTILLLKEGATIPFISRYRKELTGSLDEVVIARIQLEYNTFTELEKRKATILKTIEEQNQLTPELKSKIENTFDPTELEDIYLPYKPKKRTKASIAKEKGLEPLAKIIMSQFERNLYEKANRFVTDQVADAEEALAGARDIVAEWISENIRARNLVRFHYKRDALIVSKVAKGKEADGHKYQDYFAWSELVKRCPSHRYLAMKRGENEGILKISLDVDTDQILLKLNQQFVKGHTPCGEQVEMAIKDSFKRLLAPSIETELFNEFKAKADEEAILVFAENLRQLLMAPPLGQRRVLGIDPGYRTGCKIVCLDAQGNMLYNTTIFPHPPQREVRESAETIHMLVEKYGIEAIAIGKGTAGRDTEHFIKYIPFKQKIDIYAVNEDGASVYSASKIARDEFPDHDVTVRGAVSIGRRLMDPLAELVKIDPKSIGVGQYQHDVDQKKLQENLDLVVESCVNQVGVNLNTASKHLLTYVSGLGGQLAQNIVDYRRENGAFNSRKELLKVPRMGAKTYEQAAGFLRIPQATHPLDNSAVHPEAYYIVEKMAKHLKCKIEDLINNEDLRKQINLQDFIDEKVGLPTLKDIMAELAKPGRDPRENLQTVEFDDNIKTIEDLKTGSTLKGIVTNITKFGAFIDLGIKEKGLVHVSEMANKYISDPTQVVKLNQQVKVKVLEVDLIRKRVQLSLKQADS